jgi:ureidoacrylate peracid hydrolase
MTDFALDPGKSAFMIIDMQSVFVENSPFAAPHGLEVLGRRNRLAAVCHEAAIDVIYTAHVLGPDHSNMGILGSLLPPVDGGLIDDGSGPAALHPALRFTEEDIFLKKPRYGAFQGTDLELVLRHRNIDTLIIGGIATNVCCETTAREAAMRDFKVIFLSDGTATFGLPDMGFGPVTAEEVQNLTCSGVGFFFGQVLTVDQVIEKIKTPRVDMGSRRSA